jgi:N-acyl-D-amino-acid deacylase
MSNAMTRRTLLTSLAAGCAGPSLLWSRARADERGAGPAGGPPRRDFAPIEPLMEQFIGRHHIAGASMAVAYQGRIVSDRGYGLADVAARQPVEPQTLFSIASVTKSFTAVGVLKLVEQGKLALNARVINVLSDLHPPRGERIVDPRFRQITVHQLLFHGSGLPHDSKGGGNGERIEEAGYRELMTQPLLFEPGTDHRYSNAGFVVLRLVIERVARQPYEAFIKQHVLQPIGITRMHLEPEGGYAPEETHRYQPGGQRPAQRSGGNWLATSGDLVRFASAVAGSGGKPTFLQPQMTTVMLDCPPSLRAAGKANPDGPHVGLGWDTAQIYPKGTFLFSKNGGKPGVIAWLEHLPSDIDWAVLFNTGAPKDGPNPLAEARKVMYAAFGQVLARR